MNLSIIADALVTLPAGLALTIILTIASLSAGFLLSIPLSFVRAGSKRGPSLVVLAYTYAFRGTPLLVQLFLVYYGLGQLSPVRNSFLWPILRSPFWCALLAFSLNTAAHSTEIFRGAILSIPAGQIEAAKSLGFTKFQINRLIVCPMMIRLAMPAYSNEVVGMLKASALASTVTLLELTGLARRLVSETFAPYEVFLSAGAFYLCLTVLMTAALRSIELHLTRYLLVEPKAATGNVAGPG